MNEGNQSIRSIAKNFVLKLSVFQLPSIPPLFKGLLKSIAVFT